MEKQEQMNFKSFAADRDVVAFVRWFSETHELLEIDFRIAKSRFVPNGIYERVKGFSSALQQYEWKSWNMQKGDWTETREKLSQLKSALQESVYKGEPKNTLDLCFDILKWGGNRSLKTGAYPFLAEKFKQGTLVDYLRTSSNLLCLARANLESLSGIEKMNAMLTKVHAIYADDGLPIYDSRVAAAIATIVEMWRRNSGKSNLPIPIPLSFPATICTRSVSRAFPDVKHRPDTIVYGDKESAISWASAKVRLGWLMKLILEENPTLYQHESRLGRMHAFEACLFMIGYNVGCLNGHPSAGSKIQFPEEYTTFIHSSCVKYTSPLTGGTEIAYERIFAGDIRVEWGKKVFHFEEELLDEIFTYFGGNNAVKLGADMTRKGPEGSLGVWLKDAHKISPRWASCLAPILVNEKHASWYKKGNAICLNFTDQ